MKRKLDLPLIKNKRLAKGFTNKEMAEALGIRNHTGYLRRETGKYKFKASELPLLAKKLNIPLEKIFK